MAMRNTVNKRSADYSRKLLDDDPVEYIRNHTVTGHAYESHVGVSDATLLSNVLTGRKLGDTAYRDAQTEIYCTTELLYANMDIIMDFAEGLIDSRNGHLLLQSDFIDPGTGKPDPIGHGFIADADKKHDVLKESLGVNKIQCSSAAVVIKRNRNTQGGWEIVTSFPMAYPPEELEQPVVLDEDFSEILHQTHVYHNVDPVAQTYLDYTCSGKPREPDVRVYYLPKIKNKPVALMLKDVKGQKRFVREGEAPSAPAKGLRPARSGRRDINQLRDDMLRRIDYRKRENARQRNERMKQASRLKHRIEYSLPTADPQKGLET